MLAADVTGRVAVLQRRLAVLVSLREPLGLSVGRGEQERLRVGLEVSLHYLAGARAEVYDALVRAVAVVAVLVLVTLGPEEPDVAARVEVAAAHMQISPGRAPV